MDSGDGISFGDFPHLNSWHSNHPSYEVHENLPHGDELFGCHGSWYYVWGRHSALATPCLFVCKNIDINVVV